MMTRVMGASCVRRVGSLGRFEMGDERIPGLDLKVNEEGRGWLRLEENYGAGVVVMSSCCCR